MRPAVLKNIAEIKIRTKRTGCQAKTHTRVEFRLLPKEDEPGDEQGIFGGSRVSDVDMAGCTQRCLRRPVLVGRAVAVPVVRPAARRFGAFSTVPSTSPEDVASVRIPGVSTLWRHGLNSSARLCARRPDATGCYLIRTPGHCTRRLGQTWEFRTPASLLALSNWSVTLRLQA
jgi:hypothetical protein